MSEKNYVAVKKNPLKDYPEREKTKETRTGEKERENRRRGRRRKEKILGVHVNTFNRTPFHQLRNISLENDIGLRHPTAHTHRLVAYDKPRPQ